MQLNANLWKWAKMEDKIPEKNDILMNEIFSGCDMILL